MTLNRGGGEVEVQVERVEMMMMMVVVVMMMCGDFLSSFCVVSLHTERSVSDEDQKPVCVTVHPFIQQMMIDDDDDE